MLLFQRHLIKKLLLLAVIGRLIFPNNAAGKDLDITKVGVSVGDKFSFKVETNNLTHLNEAIKDPVSGKFIRPPIPFFVVRGNYDAPTYQENDIFSMKITEISGNVINATFSNRTHDYPQIGKLDVVRNGLVIANDWDFWLQPSQSGFHSEGLYSIVQLWNNKVQSSVLGDTIIITETVTVNAYSDGETKKLTEQVTYDKNTGVVLKIQILKEMVGDNGVEEILLKQTSDKSDDSFLPDQSLFIALGTLVVMGVFINKKRSISI